MPLFEVAIIEEKEGKEYLLVKPEAIIAKDRDAAISLMSATHSNIWKEGVPSSLEVLVRPF